MSQKLESLSSAEMGGPDRESAQARYAWFQRTYPKLQNIMQLKDVATFLASRP